MQAVGGRPHQNGRTGAARQSYETLSPALLDAARRGPVCSRVDGCLHCGLKPCVPLYRTGYVCGTCALPCQTTGPAGKPGRG